jgi:hypothetical protein
MTKLKEPNSWSSLVVTAYEEAGRRWLSVWGDYYRLPASWLASSPFARTFAAESMRSYHAASQDVLVARNVEVELSFLFDDVTESVGPRYIKLPSPAWATDLPNLIAIRGSGALALENVVVRVEAGLLSVSLIDLRASFTGLPASRCYGHYTLTFDRDSRRIPLSAGPPTHLSR